MAGHGDIYRSGDTPPNSTFYDQGKFGRLFPSLPPFASATQNMRDALKELGKKGGIMDARDKLAADPKDLIVDPALSANNPDNPDHTAGMTFLGQFLDHDMTLDASSSLEQQVDPEMIENFRRPIFELDGVYGTGPSASSHLDDQSVDSGFTSLLVETNPGSEALTRRRRRCCSRRRRRSGTSRPRGCWPDNLRRGRFEESWGSREAAPGVVNPRRPSSSTSCSWRRSEAIRDESSRLAAAIRLPDRVAPPR